MKSKYISANLIGRNVPRAKSNERQTTIKGKLAFNADGSLKL